MSPLFEGLRVVEVATFVFAPGAGTVLSDFGAEVIHVEPPGIGDPMRVLYRMRPLPECEHNYPWLLDSRNKKSIVIDLKRQAGQDVLLDLVRDADVFITNYQPSVLDALNLTWEHLRAVNPRLVFAHATGYGTRGEEVEKPGYDATAWWARSGLMDAVRPQGGELALATAAMGDHPSSVTLLAGIAMALYARERTGEGTLVSSSLMANGAWANSMLLQAALCGARPYEPPSQATTGNAMLNHYRAADGRSFYLVLVKEAEEFGRLCAAIERPELACDPRFSELEERRAHSRELVAILNEVFAAHPLSHWRDQLDAQRITFGVVATSEECVSDPQMLSNGLFPEFGNGGGQRVVASPLELEAFPKIVPRMPPALGEHSREILERLGYDDERRRVLSVSGVVPLD